MLFRIHSAVLRRPTRIVVGMSGGVDSSVAAALLRREGHEVIAVTLRTWPKEECGSSVGRSCCNLEAIVRSRAVAERLKIPHYVIDVSDRFRRDVIDYFCAAYCAGQTPNPCVVCNEKLKFSALLERAASFGAEYVATGHYAQVLPARRGGRCLLTEGVDAKKDQSYFLFRLTQEQLRRSIFPLGRFTKDAVRRLARRFRLPTFDTISSQDICFIRDTDYADYIRRLTGSSFESGDIVSEDGAVLGRHQGIPFYTIGQRRGLGIAAPEPLYVVRIDPEKNRVVVGPRSSIMKKSLTAGHLNWISVPAITRPISVMARIRYNHTKAPAVVTKIDADRVRVDFSQGQAAPTPGQAVVFYAKNVVVGGGWIEEAC